VAGNLDLAPFLAQYPCVIDEEGAAFNALELRLSAREKRVTGGLV